jgi:molybdenum cofactor cytidylyltransferase
MITAIILAAGESKRMGEPKMLMPWGKSTILQTVVSTFQAAGVSDILIVTGGVRRQVETLIGQSAQVIFNQAYQQGEMLSSLQVGLRAKKQEASAALIALGDQPQVQKRTIQSLMQVFNERKASIIVPSYQMKRGHPWLVARDLWDEILAMKSPRSPRDFLNAHVKEIVYIDVDTPSVVEDIDTPDDYLKSRP